MAYTTPKTWTTGEVLTAADQNTYVRDNVTYLYTPATASAYRNTNQSITDSTWTAITLPDGEDFDTDSMHSVSTNTSRMTIATGKAGRYRINGIIEWATNATGWRGIRFTKNGATVYPGPLHVATSATFNVRQSHTFVVTLAVADYVEMQGFQSSGGALNVSDARFQVTWEGN